MNRLFCGIIFILIISACDNDNAEEINASTGHEEQQNERITWKFMFPSLWNAAYAADISPEDVTYEQFLQALADKLKTDADFRDNVKGETGDQGTMGHVGPQGIQGIPGQDGSDAAIPSWETMYTFGTGDNYFYKCNSNTPCTADDITFYQSSPIETLNYYYRATLNADPISGVDHLNSDETISNIHANSDCEYKAELLSPTSSVNVVLLPQEIRDGSVVFLIRGVFANRFNVAIGDASTPLQPRLIISRDLPYSFSATQYEKDLIANEFSHIGTVLSYQVILKRRCI